MAFPLDQSVSFTGQQNLSGEQRALFQTLFAGEVLTEFHAKNIMMERHRVRTIQNGSSAEFPMIGTANAQYHTPGQLIEGGKIAHSKRRVTIDGLAISPVFIDKVDEAMLHYDVRSIYSKECGVRLSELVDRNILRMAVKSASITNESQAVSAGLEPVAGETFTDNFTMGAVGDEIKGDKIVASIYAAVEQFATKNISTEGLTIYLRPQQYYALFNTTDTSKMFWMNKDVGGVGSFSQGQIPTIAGLPVMMTNHLPATNDVTGGALSDSDPEWTGAASKYRVDAGKCVALIMGKNAIATVKLFDLATEMEWQTERQGTLFLAKYAMGHNILRPAEAIVINAA
jgi:hypothetical protein